ncbi:hypothetical protein QMZ05_05025 [Bradyrhizobium sp. INPA03-11B]|uniref:hypothetical protein n=1 Tax=Bradyrhizobium sp. INPA03-11B TaxID=418598 RepID=UPI00338E773F
MTDRLYRFRPLCRLLDKNELLNQEIFFAAPDNLNDPMEGFRDIFWKGDEIAWANLFRHYLLCLEWGYSIVSLGGESEPLSWRNIPILNVDAISFTPQYAERINKLIEAFLANESIKKLVRSLSAMTHPIRREELAAYLQPVHTLALSIIKRNYSDHGLARKAEPDSGVDEYLKHTMEQVDLVLQSAARLAAEAPDAERAVAGLFEAQRYMLDELKFIDRYNKSNEPFEPNRAFVLFEFPIEYVGKLETLVYPDWYTACFMKECRDSSVWGSYGDNHTAACLIFNVGDGKSPPSLRLRRIAGANGSDPVVDYVPHYFQEVVYENEHLPVDFFRSLGRVPVPDLSRGWFTDRAGRRSICADDMFNDEKAWRERYWEAFNHGITRKLQAWHYEKEQRLILTGMGYDFMEPSSRLTHYDFKDLEGIIFGIKTPIDKKIAICRVIEEKCRASNRTDFRFFQAYYAQGKGCIEHREMKFLRFNLPRTNTAIDEDGSEAMGKL